ncbi:hypothetical protein D3C84_1148910 [compost metagenome]
MVGGAADGQGDGNHCLQRLTEGSDLAPVIAVRHVPGVQHEQHPRGELHQPDQAQVQHVAGELVKVPTDGHCEHLEAAGGKNPGEPERHERSLVA